MLQEEREMELSVSREKSRIEFIVERTLTRQKLMSTGVSLANVDRLLPESC